jgi:cell division septation protein DedD
MRRARAVRFVGPILLVALAVVPAPAAAGEKAQEIELDYGSAAGADRR